MTSISKTEFFEAVRAWEEKKVVTTLLDRKDFATLTDSKGRTPLHVCASRPLRYKAEASLAIATAKALMEAGADVNAIQPIPDDGEVFPATALWYALGRGRNPALAAYLLKCKADPNGCMFALVYADDLDSAKLVRRYGAKVDEVFSGESALIYATRHQRDKFAEWLLQQGADPNFRDRRGFSALHHAVRRRLPAATLKAFLRAGADRAAVATDGTLVAQLATRAQRELLGIEVDAAKAVAANNRREPTPSRPRAAQQQR